MPRKKNRKLWEIQLFGISEPEQGLTSVDCETYCGGQTPDGVPRGTGQVSRSTSPAVVLLGGSACCLKGGVRRETSLELGSSGVSRQAAHSHMSFTLCLWVKDMLSTSV